MYWIITVSNLTHPDFTRPQFVSMSLSVHHNSKDVIAVNFRIQLIPPWCHIWQVWSRLIVHWSFFWSQQTLCEFLDSTWLILQQLLCLLPTLRHQLFSAGGKKTKKKKFEHNCIKLATELLQWLSDCVSSVPEPFVNRGTVGVCVLFFFKACHCLSAGSISWSVWSGHCRWNSDQNGDDCLLLY